MKRILIALLLCFLALPTYARTPASPSTAQGSPTSPAIGNGGGGGSASISDDLGIIATPNPITGTGTIGIDTTVVPQLGAINVYPGGNAQILGGTPGMDFPPGWVVYSGTDINNASVAGLFPSGAIGGDPASFLLSTVQGTGTEQPWKICETADPNSLTNKCVVFGEGIELIPQNSGGSLTVGLGVPGFSAGSEPERIYKGVGAYMPAAPAVYNMYRANGTLASPTAVTNNDVLSSIVSYGYDGSGMTPGSEVDTVVDAAGTVSAGRVPSDWLLYTYNPSGAKTQAIRVDMSQNANFAGNMLVNGTLQLGGISSAGILVNDSIGRVSSTAAPTSTTAAQFDSSTQLATDGFVYGQGDFFKGIHFSSGAETLTSAQCGGVVLANSGTPYTITMPLVSSCAVSSGASPKITFVNQGSAAITLQGQGSDVFVPASSGAVTSLVMQPGETFLVSNYTGSHAWEASGGSTQLRLAKTLPATALAAQTANTVVANGSGSSASPTAMAMPSCSSGSNALTWTSGTGFGCNTFSSTTVSQTISYQPGSQTSIANTPGAYSTFSKSSILSNLVASANVFICTSAPVITLYECGTDATCASPTTMGSVTVTAGARAFVGSISSSLYVAGDYIAWAITSGACTSLDINANAQLSY